MPVERHVFLAQLTGITDESELEGVLVRTRETINAFALAAFRIHSAGPHDCYGVARDRARAPRVPFPILVQIDIERAIGLDYPDCAERVRPRSNESGLSGLRKSGAAAEEHHNQAR